MWYCGSRRASSSGVGGVQSVHAAGEPYGLHAAGQKFAGIETVQIGRSGG